MYSEATFTRSMEESREATSDVILLLSVIVSVESLVERICVERLFDVLLSLLSR